MSAALVTIHKTPDRGYVIFDPGLLDLKEIKGIVFIGWGATWVVRELK